jgi:hypothetical protein
MTSNTRSKGREVISHLERYGLHAIPRECPKCKQNISHIAIVKLVYIFGIYIL